MTQAATSSVIFLTVERAAKVAETGLRCDTVNATQIGHEQRLYLRRLSSCVMHKTQ